MNTDKKRRGVRITVPPAMFAALAVAVVCCVAFGQQAGAPSTAPTTAPVQGAIQERTLFELFQAGGPFMYALLACSILSVAIIIERLVSLRKSAAMPPGFMAGLRGVYRDPQEDRAAALEYCRLHDSSIARIVAAGIRRIPRGAEATEKAVEDAGANEALKLRKNVRMLYALGSVATLLGLIGTISGMIKAFQVAAGGGLGKAELLAKGIYEAMVNTFGGLAVAIVCTIFYYLFLGRIERLVTEMNDAVGEFAERYLPSTDRATSSAADDEMEPAGAGR
jgi:biopolymer transport protein ExbB